MTVQKKEVSLRPVSADDREMIFRWRNDPFILKHGSSNREVSWIEHQKWFDETLRQQRRKMFVVQREEVPIGQVRFDRQNQRDCVISVYLLREFTGHGWGVQAIRQGCEEILNAWDVERVIACVRSENADGLSAFLKAGFEMVDLADCLAGHHTIGFKRSITLNV